jgi:hypothetical protein
MGAAVGLVIFSVNYPPQVSCIGDVFEQTSKRVE